MTITHCTLYWFLIEWINFSFNYYQKTQELSNIKINTEQRQSKILYRNRYGLEKKESKIEWSKQTPVKS